MNLLKQTEAIAHSNSPTCVAYEYDAPTAVLNGAVIEISGRYPDNGWAANRACTSMVYIIEGLGTVESDHGTKDLSPGDQLFISPGEKYSFDGAMKLLYVSTPAWEPGQAQHIR